MYKKFIKESRFKPRYIRLVDFYLNNPPEDNYHKHHILPRKIYPEFINLNEFSFNKVLLPYRAHYIAHYFLAKIYGGNMWYAFNMMSNFYKGNSYIYEKCASGTKNLKKKPLTQEQKKAISARTKNSIVIKDKDGNTFRVSTQDPRYLSGELVFYRTGYTYTEETKMKMKENSIKGKVAITDSNVTRYIDPGEELPDNFIYGNTLKDKPKEYGLLWFTNGIKNIRLGVDDIVPNGFTSGRTYKNNPFRKKKLITALNIYTDETKRITTEEYNKNKLTYISGVSKDRLVIFLYKDNVYPTYNLLCENENDVPDKKLILEKENYLGFSYMRYNEFKNIK